MVPQAMQITYIITKIFKNLLILGLCLLIPCCKDLMVSSNFEDSTKTHDLFFPGKAFHRQYCCVS